jgi:tRNA (guanine37-N1)-methyltransferase
VCYNIATEDLPTMHFDILTLFPGLFAGVFEESIVKRAREAGRVTISLHNIRDYAAGRHQVTDDAPYGGGGGMIVKPEPIFAAVEAVLAAQEQEQGPVPIILLTPQGRLFNQQIARELSHRRRLLLICGRYEGVDQRVHEDLATDEISIGDYVLAGGEIPAMVVVEAVTRLIPGVLGDPAATFEDSHAEGLLEYPHYTRPPLFRGHAVPDVLLSGHHAQIVRWRRQQALRRTWQMRPDLLRRASLTEQDRAYLRQLEAAGQGNDDASSDAP